jgi:hypothetical protein
MIFIDLVQQIMNGCLYLKMLLISYQLEEIVNDFLLIYGGIGASGYSMSYGNSTGGTHSYTLLDSLNLPPKAASSQR